MTCLEQDTSFFEALEAAAKRLSVASDLNQSTTSLKMLFDEMKEDMCGKVQPKNGDGESALIAGMTSVSGKTDQPCASRNFTDASTSTS
jgi:hypothetical protein